MESEKVKLFLKGLFWIYLIVTLCLTIIGIFDPVHHHQEETLDITYLLFLFYFGFSFITFPLFLSSTIYLFFIK
jgi:hypothetical protein